MKNLDKTFFTGKRPWSKIKDKVLGGYMPAYLRKVGKLGRPILLIDGYAGPGVFEDQSPGSPLIMCAAAEQHANNQYNALFFNHSPSHHKKLEDILKKKSWYPQARAILGDSSTLLNLLSQQLRDHTVFVYLDPFGLKGCEFKTLEPFFTRSKNYSTEIVINISMPITHRLASANEVAKGQGNEPKIKAFHSLMTSVFGGEYWKEIYFSDVKPEEKEFALMNRYCSLISNYLPYTGSCPVREDSNSRIKYFITFASRHPDAMLLMNDEMCKAYFGQMHEADWAGTLFEQSDWKSFRTINQLDSILLDAINRYPNMTRKDLWLRIVQENFMQYTETEYRQGIARLVSSNQVKVIYTQTKRLNDDCIIVANAN